MSADYLAKAAEKIDQWEERLRAANEKPGHSRKVELTHYQAEKIARAWLELAAIERGVAPESSGEET